MMLSKHGPEGFRLNERGVAAEDHHLLCIPAGRFGAEDGMACALLFFLHHRCHWIPLQHAADFFALVAHNNCTLLH